MRIPTILKRFEKTVINALKANLQKEEIKIDLSAEKKELESNLRILREREFKAIRGWTDGLELTPESVKESIKSVEDITKSLSPSTNPSNPTFKKIEKDNERNL